MDKAKLGWWKDVVDSSSAGKSNTTVGRFTSTPPEANSDVDGKALYETTCFSLVVIKLVLTHTSFLSL